MKQIKIIFFLLCFPLLICSTSHKFYVSTTNIEYVKEKESVQIITKIFTEDLEQALQARYSESISLDSKKEGEIDVNYLKKYLQQKIKMVINGKPVTLIYIGKEYDIDIVKIYYEIENISEFKTLEIENNVLFDMFPEQQNIIHLTTTTNKRSFILDKPNPKGVLNFQ